MQLIEGRHYRSELLAKLEVEHAQASPRNSAKKRQTKHKGIINAARTCGGHTGLRDFHVCFCVCVCVSRPLI
jgi:hypothetical protein